MKFALAVAMRPADYYLPLALAAEACAWDSIVVADSVFYPEQVSAPYPYTADGQRFWSPETPYLRSWPSPRWPQSRSALRFMRMS